MQAHSGAFAGGGFDDGEADTRDFCEKRPAPYMTEESESDGTVRRHELSGDQKVFYWCVSVSSTRVAKYSSKNSIVKTS